ncbi:MAG: threonine synthase [Planctomycetia bacterium]|nr:threonine synthase [Planctomycetia bacterium]
MIATVSEFAFQRCLSPDCGHTLGIEEVATSCPECGSLLDVAYDWDRLALPKRLQDFEARWSQRGASRTALSGVWRFHALLPFVPEEQCVSVGEGQTLLHASVGAAEYAGVDGTKGGKLYLQYEGLNPSGSFKDNGMAAAFTHAKLVGAHTAACASTGNTSASLAMYASVTRIMKAVIFIGSGKIAYGKLSQGLDYGALTIQIDGDFDDAMARVQEVSRRSGIYLVNSVNPFRPEGQKAIMYRVLESLRWEIPDWIVVPGGNLGNSSAFGKAFMEMRHLGLVNRVPRLAVINATGADTLYRLYEEQGLRWNGGRTDHGKIDAFYAQMDAEGRHANTIASAIEINRPVNLTKCLRALDVMNGVVRRVSDQEIVDAKARIGASGFGCEPASASTVAGVKRLVEEGVIGRDERIVCVLTGHQLKDPDATVAYHTRKQDLFAKYLERRGVTETPYGNRPVLVPNDPDAIMKILGEGKNG